MEVIKKAISKRIFDEFGDKIKIYSEKIEQGFYRPCFFIDIENGKIQKRLGGDNLIEINVQISYYPLNDDDKKEKMAEVGVNLIQACERIKTENGWLKFISSQYNIGNDKLDFEIKYRTRLEKNKIDDGVMKKLHQEWRLGND